MTMPPELAALRDEAMAMSCESWAIRKRWPLAPGIDRAGPCPVCGGTDRFAIHTKKNTFLCRRCGISGHGVIDLVMATERVEFVKACEIITGRSAAAPVDEARLRALREKADAEARQREADAAAWRERARRQGFEIWKRGQAPVWPIGEAGSAVPAYLRRRGIGFGFGDHEVVEGAAIALREIPAHPWRERIPSAPASGEDADRSGDPADGRLRFRTLHIGPAMLAAVQLPDGRFGAVHQTWLDLAQPKGKLVLPDDEAGRPRPAKKVLGAKKGGAIRLYGGPSPSGMRQPVDGRKKWRRLVMGEGIETTLTALAHAYEAETAYWAGVDLGNMAGRAARDAEGRLMHATPDLDDRDCFIPPDWVEELVFLCDSDEPENHTVEKVTRGLRRAQAARPGIATWLVEPVGDGRDLNDLVRVGAG